MLILVALVQSILLTLLHAESEEKKIGFVQHSVEGARQITISGQIANFEGSKPVLISLKCTGPEQVFPLVLALYEDKLELSAEPGDTPTRFDRRFQNGRIVITISIFSDKFYVTIKDSSGFSTYDLAPAGWFGTDFAVYKNCEQREIIYFDGAFVHDKIQVDPTPSYVHKVPFLPGNSIKIDGEVKEIAEKGFDVSMEYTEENGMMAPFMMGVRKGKIFLHCRNDVSTVDAVIPMGVLEIRIDLFDTHSAVGFSSGNEELSRLQCLHGELISKLSRIHIGPISSFISRTPQVEQMDGTPVYIARYSNDSAYQIYKKATEKDAKLVKKTLGGGASSYGLNVDDIGKWQLVPSQPGSIGFHFARLPSHFTACPCDCLSDVNNVILLDQFQNSNFTAENQLKTVVFYQWRKNQRVRFQTTKQFALEIFSRTTKHGECVWGTPLGLITSIKEEYEAVMTTEGNLLTEYVAPNEVNHFGIKIWHENSTFHIRAFGVLMEFKEAITFVQIVGLKSILHYEHQR